MINVANPAETSKFEMNLNEPKIFWWSLPLKYKIAIPSRIKFVTKSGYAIIPGSKGLISKYSGRAIIVFKTTFGNTTVVSAIRMTTRAAKKIIHKTRLFRWRLATLYK
jgi:hypothetical protein